MMKCIFTFFIFLCTSSCFGQTLFWSDTFEDAGAPSSGSRTPSIEFSCGSPATAYFFRTAPSDIALQSGTYSNYQGSKIWAAEDVDKGSTCTNASISANQTVTWSSINISGKNGLSFKGLFAANSINGAFQGLQWGTQQDKLEVEYRIDGGAWQRVIGFYSDNGINTNSSNVFSQDLVNNDFVGDGTALSYTFTEFTATIAGTGTTLDLRLNIFVNASAAQEVAVDNFRLYETIVTNTTWNGSSWSNGNPSSTIDAIIASSTAPSSFTCKSLTINSGVALTTTGITATINGNITNNGNGIAGTGTVTIAASSTLSGNAVSFNGTLTVSSGATFTTGGLLTLSSNSTSTGRIGNSAGTISGNVTVQRFIPAKSTRRFSFITSPVSQTLSAAWQQQIHITGTGTGGTACPLLTAHSNGFDATISNAPSMYSYNASLAANSRWVANTTGTTAFTLTPGTGYRLNVRGARSTGCSLLDGTGSGLIPTAVTLSATGAVNNASKNAGSFTNTYNNNTASNYVLIGNPYPCELDFSAFRSTNSSVIGSSYVLYDPQNAPNLATPSNMYSTWNAGTWSNAATGISNANGQYIANGQAFFVQATAASNITLTFNEAHKYSGTQNGVFRTRSWTDIIRIALNKEGNNIDQTVLRYTNDPAANSQKLCDLDATLFSSGEAYLGTKKDNNLLAIQTRVLSTVYQDTVAIDFNAAESGSYELNFSAYEQFTAATGIYLLDRYRKTMHDVKQTATYVFTVDKNEAATQTNRFALVFSKATIAQIIAGVKVYPNPVDKTITVQLPPTAEKYTVSITDIAGKKLYQSQLPSGIQTISIAQFTKGNYVIEITDTKGNRAVEKLVKQ